MNWFTELKKNLLKATHDGLDIIAFLVPQADTTKINATRGTKAFKSPFRNEKTASCTLYYSARSESWGITDFGDTDGDRNFTSAIDLYMRLNHIAQSDVSTALLELCMKFNVPTGDGKVVLKKPEIISTKTDEIKPFSYKICDWTEMHFAVFNPRANHKTEEGVEIRNNIIEAAQHYGLIPVSEYTANGTDKDGNMVRRTVKATTVFPLFIWINGLQENHQDRLDTAIKNENFEEAASLQQSVWGKIYQPYAAEKKHRFFHFGTKPERFIYGLDGLKKHYDNQYKLQTEKLSSEQLDDNKFMKKFKNEFKLDEVIITTGGSDGINVAALGFYTVWSNSETNFLTPSEYAQLKKYARTIYYVGDLDETGKRSSYKIGMKYIDCRIIRLPEELKKNRGWRGEQAKDVKDYCRYYSGYDFRGLMRIASPFQFWNFNPNSKAAIPYSFNPKAGIHFLAEHGFRKFKNTNLPSGYELVRVDGNIVYKVLPDDLKKFLIDFCFEQRCNEDIINLIYRTKAVREEFARDLPWFSESFKRGSKFHQYWFFEDKIWKITADKVEELKAGTVPIYTWSDKVYTVPEHPDYRIQLQDDPFTVTRDEDGTYNVKIDYDFQFTQFVVNTSKVHWVKEFKLAKQETDINQETATQLGLNTIDGAKLDPDERYEQILHFLSKVSMLGYLLNTHKDDARGWAPWVTENTEREVKEAHGGTGKSLLFKPIHDMILTAVWKDGRNIKDEKFLFGSVNETHELFVVADADKSTSLSPYFNAITDGVENRTLYSLGSRIPYEKSPKIVFISNYFPWDLSPSDLRRLWPIGFADYYHSIGGQFADSRNPGEDFGRNLYSSWSPEEWVKYFNFLKCCIQVYLKFGRINPPMASMNRQMAKIAMGQNFEAWAREYFTDKVNAIPSGFVFESNNVSGMIWIPSKLALADYQEYLKQMRSKNEMMTESSFMAKVKQFAQYNGWIFNPATLLNKSGRMQRKVSDSVMDHLYNIYSPGDGVTSYEPNPAKANKFISLKRHQVTIKHDTVVDMILLAVDQDRLKISDQNEAENEPYIPAE